MDTGALDQRHRQPRVRLPGLGVRRRIHLVASTAARTSSRRGPTIRSATRRARRSTSATRRPARCGARPRCRSGRTPRPTSSRHGQGYSRFEHTSHGIALDLAAVRADRGPGEDLAAHHREPVRQAPPPLGDRVRRVGAGRLARRDRAVHRHRGRRGHGRDLRAQRLEHRLRRSRRLRRPRRPPDRVDRRSHGVPGPQRHAGPSRAARARRPPVRAGSAPASIPARPSRP